MSESVYSSYWYRVAELRPRLRNHAQLHRHEGRGDAWYVLQDPASGRNLRLSAAAWRICGLMDGSRTVHEIWEATTRRLGDDAPSQDETIQLLARLHANDVLLCDVPPDSLELFTRFERQERKRFWGRFANPLSLRFPLLDPERLLEAGLPAGPVMNTEEVMDNPHTLHRDMRWTKDWYTCTGTPIKFSRTPGSLKHVPPHFASDTRDILAEHGFSDDEVKALYDSDVLPTERRR